MKNLIVPFLALLIMVGALFVIAGQKRGARIYLKFLWVAARNIGIAIYHFAAWFFTCIGYGVEDAAGHFPAAVGAIVSILIAALIYFLSLGPY